MKDRESSQDRFNKTNFVFTEKTTDFSKAFPGIEKLRIEITEKGNGITPGFNTSVITNSNMCEYSNCSNKSCVHGGVHIGELVRSMMHKKETLKEEYKICIGNEGSPKGKRVYRKCLNRFDIKIEISYIEPVSDEKSIDAV